MQSPEEIDRRTKMPINIGKTHTTVKSNFYQIDEVVSEAHFLQDCKKKFVAHWVESFFEIRLKYKAPVLGVVVKVIKRQSHKDKIVVCTPTRLETGLYFTDYWGKGLNNAVFNDVGKNLIVNV